MSTIQSKFIHNFPPSDNNVYVIQNGAFVPVALVNHPAEWNPDIDDIDDSNTIYLTLNENMTPLQLTGLNAEVNS